MSQSFGGLKLRQTRQSRGLDEPRPTDVGPPGSLPQRRDFPIGGEPVIFTFNEKAGTAYTAKPEKTEA